jgi:hypothetical protein
VPEADSDNELLLKVEQDNDDGDGDGEGDDDNNDNDGINELQKLSQDEQVQIVQSTTVHVTVTKV